jgi:hypothetical protein
MLNTVSIEAYVNEIQRYLWYVNPFRFAVKCFVDNFLFVAFNVGGFEKVMVSPELTSPQFSSGVHTYRDPSIFEQPDFQELKRLMELKLHLVPISSIPYNYYIHPHRPSRSVRFPNLYFSGTSLGLCGNEEVPVHGSVNMSDDGVVRWRFVSWVSFFAPKGHCADCKLIRYLFSMAF